MVEAVYDELRKLARAYLARERPGHTLQPTALVHEVYLRLGGEGEAAWNSRGHFFGAAARAMRQILIEHARARAAGKRGGGRARIEELDTVPDHRRAHGPSAEERLTLGGALERLAAAYPRKAEIVRLRYLAGLTVGEIAVLLDVTPRTVERDWRFARAWLEQALTAGPEPSDRAVS
jgi:RNA polymerase sigma factor (TIGR02999 family)